MVCVHQDGSAHWARNASISRSSSWPDWISRERSSVTVSRQYSAHGSPPWYSAVSRCRRDVLQAQPGQHGGQLAADEVVDALRPRPGQPAVPERPDLSRLGHADRQEVRLDEQDRPARPGAGHQVGQRDRDVPDMVQHGPRGDQVEAARLEPGRPGCRPGGTPAPARPRWPATGRGPPPVPARPVRPARPARPIWTRCRSPLPASAHLARPRRAARCAAGASGRAAATSAPAAAARPADDDQAHTLRPRQPPRVAAYARYPLLHDRGELGVLFGTNHPRSWGAPVDQAPTRRLGLSHI